MRRGRFTEDQIIGVLREHEAGVKTAELRRKHGISDATFYNWKAEYGGMTVSEAARLRTLGKQAPMAIPQDANPRWSLDFLSDALACGRAVPTVECDRRL